MERKLSTYKDLENLKELVSKKKLTRRSVASLLDVSHATITNRVRDFNLPHATRADQKRIHLPRETITTDYLAGETLEELGREWGVNPSTIRARLIKWKVQLRPRGSKPGRNNLF
jgi:hypothetical protein